MNIPKKNYIIVILLFTFTVAVTLIFSSIYTNKKEESVSNFYESTKKINYQDVENYLLDNPESIIYITDKNNKKYTKVEKKLESRLEKLKLKDSFVIIEYTELENGLNKYLKDKYNTTIEYNNSPIMIIINNDMIEANITITDNTNVNDILSEEVFE